MKKVGGQALFNGIMMIGSKASVVLRQEDGTFITKERSLHDLKFKIPVLRGIVSIFRQLFIGLNALFFSFRNLQKKLYLVLLFIFFIFTFVYPMFIPLPTLWGLEDFIDIILLISFLVLLSFSPQIKSMLRFHGAEHKTIHCYEHGMDLTIENVKLFPKEHPRCGTSFVVVIVFLNLLLDITLSLLLESDQSTLYYAVSVPFIFGIAYEIITVFIRKQHLSFVKALMKPGLLMQKLTTKEPSDQQIEVAITALKKAIEV